MPSYTFDTVNDALPALAEVIMRRGQVVESRAGNTRELTNVQITLQNPLHREILVPRRKASLRAQVAETMWVLAGRNDVEWLSRYLPRAADFSDDGETWRAGYGPRLRDWQADLSSSGQGTDQLANIVELLKRDPETRRAVISLWDPAADVTDSKDIPCNNWLHFLPRDGVLNLTVSTRSNDLIWGWSGINQFEWSVLLQVVAHLTGLKVGKVVYNITSLHIYENHFDRARELYENGFDENVDKYVGHPLYRDCLAGIENVDQLDCWIGRWFQCEELLRHGESCAHYTVDMPPLFLQWLQVLFGAKELLPESTRKAIECGSKPKPPKPELNQTQKLFLDEVDRLHREKDEVYGDSWIKRGVTYSTLPNIARKIDRLGVAGAGDTTYDTVMDLWVYLAKLKDRVKKNTSDFTGAEHRNRVRDTLSKSLVGVPQLDEGGRKAVEESLTNSFELLLTHWEGGDEPEFMDTLDEMLEDAASLTYAEWPA